MFLDENFNSLPDPKKDLIYINMDNFSDAKKNRKFKTSYFEVLYIVPQEELTEKSPEEIEKWRRNRTISGDFA